MRFSLAILAAFVAAVSAQSITDLPPCIGTCVTTEAGKITACKDDAVNCYCNNKDFQAALIPCVSGCATEDQTAALDVCTASPASESDGGASETGGAASGAPTGSGSAGSPTGSAGSTPRPSGSTTQSTSSPSSTTAPGDGAVTVGVSVAAVVGAVAAMML